MEALVIPGLRKYLRKPPLLRAVPVGRARLGDPPCATTCGTNTSMIPMRVCPAFPKAAAAAYGAVLSYSLMRYLVDRTIGGKRVAIRACIQVWPASCSALGVG